MNCKIKSEWLAMEGEHTSNKAKQLKIVNQHIKEYGCNYYPALKKMEAKLKK
jgi:hypothetical protein